MVSLGFDALRGRFPILAMKTDRMSQTPTETHYLTIRHLTVARPRPAPAQARV
jgi:hypothetical protein